MENWTKDGRNNEPESTDLLPSPGKILSIHGKQKTSFLE